VRRIPKQLYPGPAPATADRMARHPRHPGLEGGPMSIMSEPTPSATYYMNVEHDPPKPKPWKLTPRKAKKRKAVSRPHGGGAA
jgi:hypothetical protein